MLINHFYCLFRLQFRPSKLNLQILCDNSNVYAASHHGNSRPSESSHTTVWFCLPSFCLSVCLSQSEKEEKATVILSPGDFKQTVDRVKALILSHVFSVASTALAVDFAARLKGRDSQSAAG